MPETALDILNRLRALYETRDTLEPLRPGTSIHAVERSAAFGPARTLEGVLLIEQGDGTLRRINGAELTELAERHPEFLRHWRLPE